MNEETRETVSRSVSRREFLKIAGIAGAGITVAGGLGGLLAACGEEETTTTTAAQATTTTAAGGGAATTTAAGSKPPAKEAGPEFLLAWIHANSGYESAAQARAAGLQYFQDHNIKWTYEETDCKNDGAKIVSAIEDAVAKKANAIMTDFADLRAASNAIQKANAANIPIFTIDTGSYVPGTVCEVTTNNAENAAKNALYMVNQLGGEGKVCLLDLDVHAGVRMRVQIYKTVVGQFPGIELLEYHNADPSKYVEDCTNTMATWISKHGLAGINAVLCGWDEAGMGASNAIIAAGGSRKDIIVCGYDGHRDVVVDKMADETYPVVATIAQNFPAYTGIVIDLIQRICVNGESVESVLGGKKTIYVRASLVTKDNISQVPARPISTAMTPDNDYGDYTNVTNYEYSWQ